MLALAYDTSSRYGWLYGRILRLAVSAAELDRELVQRHGHIVLEHLVALCIMSALGCIACGFGGRILRGRASSPLLCAKPSTGGSGSHSVAFRRTWWRRAVGLAEGRVVGWWEVRGWQRQRQLGQAWWSKTAKVQRAAAKTAESHAAPASRARAGRLSCCALASARPAMEAPRPRFCRRT